MEDARAAAPQSAPSPNAFSSESSPDASSESRSSRLQRAFASSPDAPPRSESQRLRAWNDHRAHLQEFTDENFEREVVQAQLPVIIDFWAESCGPCKLMHPIMRRLAEVWSGRAIVGRLNVYENPRTTEALEIKAIPYLVVVQGGDVIFELVGDRQFDDLKKTLEPFLAP